ncbi:hypothetical protein HELRODRAFT_170990 [Helobdella robusta]|uniref:Ectonucleoside triphosphate diphosphohydrolase 1 n=1 Tax=Helobdella robusta TaxID=6412 RepID=T1F3N7_HELRO|nr:hypothetical protein HELRODRAFT_170990 [Helobdella robusta]ESO06954.1 hypothetical protein HELRODRAFT_170990 [Helobdella robusta]
MLHRKYFMLSSPPEVFIFSRNATKFIFLLLALMAACMDCMPTTSPGYAIVVDAGSSGTRCWVYKLTPVAGNKLPKIEIVNKEKYKGGMAKQITEIKASLEKIVKFAKTHVPADQHAKTPIYFMATAGMRYLAENSATSVFDSIDHFLSDPAKCPFQHETPARILSGQEEGTFAWLSVNYLKGVLDDETLKDPTSKTFGVLEMGGASVQITFVPRSQILDNVFQFKFHRNKFHIYSHSYLNYGQETVREILDNSTLSRNNRHLSSNYVLNPCQIKDDTRAASESLNTSLLGTGHFEECVDMIRDMFVIPNKNCAPGPCTINNIYQPSIPRNQTFFAIGVIYKVLRDLGIDTSKPVKPSVIKYEATRFCSQNIPSLTDFQKLACPIGIYLYVLLVDVFKFAEDSEQIITIEEINGKTIGDFMLNVLS